MFKIISLAILSSGLIASTAVADTSIFAQSTHEGVSESGVVYIQNGKAGFTQKQAQGLEGFFDSQRKTLVVFDHEKKTYMEITEAYGKQMADTMGAMTRMLESVTAGMTAEQRQAMTGVMGRMIPQTPPPESKQKQYSVRDSGQSREVNSIQCTVKAVYKGQSKEADVCIASPSATTISNADYQTLKQLSQFGANLAESLPFAKDYAGTSALLEETRGIPVEVNAKDYTVQVQKITQSVPAKLFKIPAGYQKTDPMSQLGSLLNHQ